MRNVSRLVSRESRDGVSYFCDFCSFSNSVKEKVLKHQESCTGDLFEPEREFPKPETFLRFKNFERSSEQPFVIYADFESRLKPMCEKKGGFTTQFQEHIPIGYAYYLVCRFGETQYIFRSYTARSEDEDIGLNFVKSIRDTVLDVWMMFRKSKPIKFTESDKEKFLGAKECWICGRKFRSTDSEYAHAKDVWKTFGMKTMREYHDLYLKTDVLLLADVFENFRSMALEHFKVDPCHYATTPRMFCSPRASFPWTSNFRRSSTISSRTTLRIG